MKNYKNVIDGVFFCCDKCGKEYTFSNSYLVVVKGETYSSPLTGREKVVAEMDLCRDCSGMTLKFTPKEERKLVAAIEEIDIATVSLLTKSL